MHFLVVTALLLAAHPDIEAARAQYFAGNPKGALQHLDEALKSPALTEDELVDVHFLRGASLFVIGRTQEAEKSFDTVLGLRPLYAPNKRETPPEIRDSFRARADAWQRANGVQLETPSVDGKTWIVRMKGKVAGIARVAVFARPRGETAYREVLLEAQGPVARGDVTDEILWNSGATAGALDVVLEARNARNVPISQAGDAMHPLQLPLTREQADAALKLLKPPAPVEKPAEKPPAPVEKPALPIVIITPPAPENPAPETPRDSQAGRVVVVEKDGPGITPMLVLGGVMLGGGVLGGAAGLLAGVGTAALFTVAAVMYSQVSAVGGDLLRSRDQVLLAYNASFIAGEVFSVVTVLVLLASIAVLSTGVVLMVLDRVRA